MTMSGRAPQLTTAGSLSPCKSVPGVPSPSPVHKHDNKLEINKYRQIKLTDALLKNIEILPLSPPSSQGKNLTSCSPPQPTSNDPIPPLLCPLSSPSTSSPHPINTKTHSSLPTPLSNDDNSTPSCPCNSYTRKLSTACINLHSRNGQIWLNTALSSPSLPPIINIFQTIHSSRTHTSRTRDLLLLRKVAERNNTSFILERDDALSSSQITIRNIIPGFKNNITLKYNLTKDVLYILHSCLPLLIPNLPPQVSPTMPSSTSHPSAAHIDPSPFSLPPPSLDFNNTNLFPPIPNSFGKTPVLPGLKTILETRTLGEKFFPPPLSKITFARPSFDLKSKTAWWSRKAPANTDSS